MILEIQIDDEVYRQYGTPEALQAHLVETAGMDLETKNWKYQLDSKNLSDLRHHFGPFKDAADLVRRILNVGSVRVQGEEYQLSGDQVQNLKVQAYFHTNHDEPSCEAEAIRDNFPKEGQKKIVQRYLDEILIQAMDHVLGVVY